MLNAHVEDQSKLRLVGVALWVLDQVTWATHPLRVRFERNCNYDVDKMKLALANRQSDSLLASGTESELLTPAECINCR